MQFSDLITAGGSSSFNYCEPPAIGEVIKISKKKADVRVGEDEDAITLYDVRVPLPVYIPEEADYKLNIKKGDLVLVVFIGGGSTNLDPVIVQKIPK